MKKYIFKRILMLIPVLFGVSFLVYFIVDLAPGDIVDVIAGDDISAEIQEQMREELGLNDPLLVRYFRYMSGLLKGDLGVSYSTNQDIFKVYMERLPQTLKLAFVASILAVGISIPLGIIAAVRQNTWKDTISMVFGLLGLSIPNFWLGLLLVIAFALKLGWFPSIGNAGVRSIILPAITLGTGHAALLTRTTRSSMLEVVRQDYLRTARAKGVSEKNVIRKHALKNALIPIITVMGTQMGLALGGAVLTESVFAWPGVGRLIVSAINARDVPMVTGCIIMTTMLTSLLILFVDIIYAFVDPQVRARLSS